MLRKHRLAERLLADVIGLDWAYVHDEACRWEHVMSEQVELRVLEMLDHPTESPYGNPIPGLAELGDAPGRAVHGRRDEHRRDSRRRAASARSRFVGSPSPCSSSRSCSQQLQAAGVMPGATAVDFDPRVRTS